MRRDRLRGSGTAATNMCLVATGAVEAFFEIGIHCWDIAAGAVIVREAGGVLMDVDGGWSQRGLAAPVHPWLPSWSQPTLSFHLWLCSKKESFFSHHLGGPFDLMSRRMVSANNELIARRIIKEIEIFDATRDDVVPEQKK